MRVCAFPQSRCRRRVGWYACSRPSPGALTQIPACRVPVPSTRAPPQSRPAMTGFLCRDRPIATPAATQYYPVPPDEHHISTIEPGRTFFPGPSGRLDVGVYWEKVINATREVIVALVDYSFDSSHICDIVKKRHTNLNSSVIILA